MNEMIVKDVDFNGATLRAAQVRDIVYVGIAWVCNGLGLDKNHKDRQIKNIQSDELLHRGCVRFDAGVFDPNNETLALELEYLPAWLFKMHITPTMRRENPELADRLIEYQLRAKDVLAEAFLGKSNAISYKERFDELDKRFDKLNADLGNMVKLIQSMRMLPPTVNPPVADEVMEWKRNVYNRADRLVTLQVFSDRADVLKYVYAYMNRNYSVVWAQESKDYMVRNNSVNKPSTIDIVYDNEMLRSIFDAVLDDLVFNSTDNNDEISATDKIISPLAIKYGDNSTHNMVTYRRVYKQMGKIGWKNLETRHINKHGGKSATRKEIINGNSAVLKKFARAVSELMKEED